MSNSDGDEVVYPQESGSFLRSYNPINLEARANGIKHFGHDHRLTFEEDVRNGLEGKDLRCNGCGIEIIKSRGFRCSMVNCKFLLHEFCAFLPKLMTDYPKHSEHPLILYTESPYPDNFFGTVKCNVCNVYHEESQFYYHCEVCMFDVDLRCASMFFVVRISTHCHDLTAQLYPASFLCRFCGEKHRELGSSYQCKTCSFWMHEECFSLPIRIKHDSHVCQLKLLYFEWSECLPKVPCGACDKYIDPTFNLYGCDRCYYFVHIKCSTEKWNAIIEIPVIQDQGEDRLIQFPLLSIDSVQNTLAQFIQKVCHWKEDEEDKIDNNIYHPGHDHPLTLEFDSSKFITRIVSDDIAKRGEYDICNACLLPLLDAPIYSCNQSCKFVLHKWCAKLPRELKHPAHTDAGHTLILHERLVERFGFFTCDGCHETRNGFAYKCKECQQYCLDVVCATLPSFLNYETHDHPLLLKHRRMSGGCISCGQKNYYDLIIPSNRDRFSSTFESPYLSPFFFGCDACHFNICVKCVILPQEVLHWYDEHGFKLTYSIDFPTQGDNTNLCYHCEFCEISEVNTLDWIYYCLECDQFVHAECVRQVFGLLPKHIKLGESYVSPYHNKPGHELICFKITKPLLRCERCKDDCYMYGIGFECKECKIVLGLECAYLDV